MWVLRGRVRIEQASVKAEGDEAVLWIDRAEAFSGRPSKVIAYLDGNVHVEFGRGGDPHAVSQTRRARPARPHRGSAGSTRPRGIELAAPHHARRAAAAPRRLRARHGRLARFASRGSNATSQRHSRAAPSNLPSSRAKRSPRRRPRRPFRRPLQAGSRVRIDGRSGGSINMRFLNDPARNEGRGRYQRGRADHRLWPRPARHRLGRGGPRRRLVAAVRRPRADRDARDATRRRAARVLPGRQHRLPPGRPRDLRRPHVLQRAAGIRRRPERRNAHARARSIRASCGSRPKCCSRSIASTSRPTTPRSPAAASACRGTGSRSQNVAVDDVQTPRGRSVHEPAAGQRPTASRRSSTSCWRRRGTTSSTSAACRSSTGR